MTIQQRQAGEVIILVLAGRLAENSPWIFRNKIRDLVFPQGMDKEGVKVNLLLNMAEVSYIDSTGIGELVSAFTTVTNYGGALKLLKLTRRVEELLRLTKLYTVFEIFDSEMAALRSFN